MFCLNFAFSRLLPSVWISRQLESEQNVRFYINLAQYVMYLSATLQKVMRIFHFVKCKIFHSRIILDKFRKVQNVIKIFNCACCRIHRPLSQIRQQVRQRVRQPPTAPDKSKKFLSPKLDCIHQFSVLNDFKPPWMIPIQGWEMINRKCEHVGRL